MKHKYVWLFGLIVLLLVFVPLRKPQEVPTSTEHPLPGDTQEALTALVHLPTADETEMLPSPTESAAEYIPASFPLEVEVEIKDNGTLINPDEIVLYVGQKVTITMTNTETISHDLIIGRDVILNDGAPVGFETDFFADGDFPSPMYGGTNDAFPFSGFLINHEDGKEQEEMKKDPFYQPVLAGHPMDYHGELTVFPPKGWLGGYASSWFVNFLVVEEMVGEWEYACFAENGQHYLNGERGKLIIRMP